MDTQDKQYLDALRTALDDKFAKDIMVRHIGAISALGDYFVLATGENANQLRAMAEAAEEALHKQGLSMRHKEGIPDNENKSGWTLLDFGDIIIHLFDKEAREFYNLERMWADAPVID